MALPPVSILSVGSHDGFGTVPTKRDGAIPGPAAGESPPRADYCMLLHIPFLLHTRTHTHTLQ